MQDARPYDVLHSRATGPVFPVVYWDRILCVPSVEFLRTVNGRISSEGEGDGDCFFNKKKVLVQFFKKGFS